MNARRLSNVSVCPRRSAPALALATVLVGSSLGRANATSVGTLPYRGELAEGGSKVTGKRALRFTVKTHPTSGQVVFEQTVGNVELNAGRFAVELGACNRADTTCTGEGGAATALASALTPVLAKRPPSLYVNVSVGDQGAAAGATFTPMGAWQRITSAPYALEAPKAILGRWRSSLSSGQCGVVSGGASSALQVTVPLAQPAVLAVRYRVRHNAGGLAVATVSTQTTGGGALTERARRAFVKQNGEDEPGSTGFLTIDGATSFETDARVTVSVGVAGVSSTSVQACSPSSPVDPSFLEVTAYAQ
jgi:hypothetical protein